MESETTGTNRSHALVGGGLTLHQAKLYEVLVTKGTLAASAAARLSGVPRTLAYKALGELVELELVSKTDKPGAVATFTAVHPFKLKEFVDKRYQEARDARQALDGVLGKLVSEFNLVSGSPGVLVLEGIAGLMQLFEDELNERQDIRLIRSPYDNDHPELDELVKAHITEQAKLGIHARIITPLMASTPRKILDRDKANLVERRIVPRELFLIPAQVVIYANKVAITAFEGTFITTIIENAAIRKTFEMIFEYIWRLAEPDDIRIRKEILQQPA